jgi:hypothetical protein
MKKRTCPAGSLPFWRRYATLQRPKAYPLRTMESAMSETEIRARMFNPPHPGLTLRDNVLPALGLTCCRLLPPTRY